MNQDQFLTAALRNPANEIIAEELFRLALPDAWLVSGCLVQTVWNVLTRSRSRLRHQRLRRILFRSRYIVGSGRQGHPHAGGAVCQPRHRGRGAQPGARSSLVSGKAWPALSGAACSTQGIDRFLTKNTQIGIRRTQEAYEVYAPNGYDDVAALIVRPNPRREFFRRELRSEGDAMEGAVAGDHGAAGGCIDEPHCAGAWTRPADSYRRG